jgi:CRP-like cAMP-binding protein
MGWEQLRGCPSLAPLSDGALRELFAAAGERTFEPGEAMVRQGDPAEGLLILLHGTAYAVLRSRDGNHVLGRFTSGDIVGEMALVTREARSADVLAESPVRALLVPTEAFDRLAMCHLELGLVLTTLVADRLGRAVRDGLGDKRIAGFRILRCIGRGGMSVVYRAEDEASGELIALKMMSYRLIYDAAALARFQQEATLHQSLRHENIARLVRLFPAYRTYFLVMELCDGVDLRRLVKACGPLRESQVRPILGQLARGLEYVHARGLVHRDLKPANVMVTRNGGVKLMDFGIAVPAAGADDDHTTAQERIVLGTPAFMAPEQLAGGVVDRRADVYALGCLAYHLLTGTHLFETGNLLDLVLAKVNLRLPPAGDIGGGVSAELHDFLQRALQVNADARPSSLALLTGWAAPCEAPPESLVEALP